MGAGLPESVLSGVPGGGNAAFIYHLYSHHHFSALFRGGFTLALTLSV